MSVFGTLGRFLREQGLLGEGMGKRRTLEGASAILLTLFGAAFSLFFLYTTFFGLISQETHVGFYFLGTVILSFMLIGARRRSPQTRISVVDGLLILGMVIVIAYYIIEYPTLADRMGGPIQPIDAVFGWFIILLSLEMARRTVGNVIPCIGVFLLIYAYLGPYFPLGLGHSGFSLARIAESLFLSGDGILGSLTNIFASYILIFVILGSFMEVSGCGKVFCDLAYAMTGKRTGGPGLASVVTSALFGTVSGSAVANVVVDGVYTIPLMKRMGYPAHFAGAVEAATSTGGQFMPPVMGAAAFLLAEISGTPYVQVIKIAAIPACLYFASVGVIIYLEAVKRGLRGMPASELPQVREILKEVHLLLPIPILIALLVMDITPFVAAFYTIGATIVVSWLRKESRMGPSKILTALVAGARSSITVGSIVGVLGIVMGACSLTGLPNYFNQFVIFLSGGHLFLLLCLVIIAGLFIGMGLPTTPSYVILVILAVPAMIKMGVAPLTAHLVAFWVAVQSNVTPPVALAAIAAAAIAKSDPWKTGWTAAKLASWVYLMPFLFIYTSILDVGWNLNFILTVIDACIALVAWGAALEGYLLKETAWYERIALLAAAVGLLHEGIATDLVGAAIFALVIVAQKVTIARATRAVPDKVPSL
ncbi:MAG TPA: TRAP transporter fused permease subunit [Candidatus Methylomirabilis sp.]|nr:TRAP transporter fused permease subunit [Candidatus Methylomirabilis sp.]